MIRFPAYLALLLLAALPLHAADKAALVIGNADYDHVEPLWNPENDARAIAGALERQGFDVTTATDLSRADMYDVLRDFRARADAVEIAVVYYAGHGIEVNGTNYLVPTDARLEDVRDARVEMVQLDDVLSQLSGARGLRMVVLDACRNNPFTAKLRAIAGGTRDVGRGLVPVQTAQAGTMIVYAAAEGQVIPDGEPGGNSPFTSAFLDALDRPPMDVRLLMGHVRDEMARRVTGAEPYVYQSIGGQEFVINTAARPTEPAAQDDGKMLRDFEVAGRQPGTAGWDAFLQRYADRSDSLLYEMALKNRQAITVEVDDTRAGKRRDLLSSEEAARALQEALAERGCYKGGIDGLIGPKSRAAYAAFTRAAGDVGSLAWGADVTDLNAALDLLALHPESACSLSPTAAATPRIQNTVNQTGSSSARASSEPEQVSKPPDQKKLPSECYTAPAAVRKNYSYCH